ncbi:MAG TPA: APC family permease [Blastocatellia bacterium]|nr:APC family permease [Blastocatellia bacterium]
MPPTISQTAINDSAAGGSFRRVLSLRDLVLFGMAFIGPTAPYSMYGIATVKSRGHLPLVYAVAMVAMGLTALSYGRMASAFPEAGSTYTYTARALHPAVGFFAGWAMILDYILIPMLSVIFVGLTANKVWPEAPYWVWALATAGGITGINLCGIRVTARANYLTNAIMGVSLVWFIALAVRALLSGTGEGTLFSTRPFFNPQTFSFGEIVNTTSLAVLSFIGFDGISTLAEDAKDPRRDIARATVLVCLLAGGLFVIESYLAQMVWPDYTTFSPVETAFMDIGRLVGGPGLFFFLSFVLVVAGIASAITGQAGASRLLCGLGRDRLLPYRVFGYVHPRLGTPVYSVLLMGGVHLVGALLLQYTEAAELVNFGAFIGFMLVNLAVVRHYWLRLGLRRGGQSLPNLILPILGFAVCFYIWLHLSRFALRLGAVWMALGLLYLLLLRRGLSGSWGGEAFGRQGAEKEDRAETESR